MPEKIEHRLFRLCSPPSTPYPFNHHEFRRWSVTRCQPNRLNSERITKKSVIRKVHLWSSNCILAGPVQLMGPAICFSSSRKYYKKHLYKFQIRSKWINLEIAFCWITLNFREKYSEKDRRSLPVSFLTRFNLFPVYMQMAVTR